MKMKKIKYLIEFYDGSEEVEGYAIDSGHPDIRICVRMLARKFWKVDHFDTGKCIGWAGYGSRTECATAGLNVMREKIASGEYAQKMVEHGYWAAA